MAQTFFTFHLLLCSIRLWDLLYMHSTVRWGDLADQAACYSPLRPHHLKYNSGHGYQCQILVHFCCLRLSHCHFPRREQFVACPASDITPIISQSEPLVFRRLTDFMGAKVWWYNSTFTPIVIQLYKFCVPYALGQKIMKPRFWTKMEKKERKDKRERNLKYIGLK